MDITSIPNYLLQFGLNDEISIARKMSRASKRQTTRREDIAYCLMGLFDVNMPLFYGEGDKAFQRLQEEIMRRSDDQSIFLWTDPTGDNYCYRGLLARHRSEFAGSGGVITLHSEVEEPYSITSTGIRMNVQLMPLSSSWLKALLPDEDIACGANELYTPKLACIHQSASATIILRRLHYTKSQVARECTHKIVQISSAEYNNYKHLGLETIYVQREIRVTEMNYHSQVYGFRVAVREPYHIGRTVPVSWVDDSGNILRSYRCSKETSSLVASGILTKAARWTESHS